MLATVTEARLLGLNPCGVSSVELTQQAMLAKLRGNGNS
jgi:hypothetical protein